MLRGFLFAVSQPVVSSLAVEALLFGCLFAAHGVLDAVDRRRRRRVRRAAVGHLDVGDGGGRRQVRRTTVRGDRFRRSRVRRRIVVVVDEEQRGGSGDQDGECQGLFHNCTPV